MTTPTDPLYPSQWHFALMGDIERIWDDYSGAGVHVGIYDDGVDYNHEDLAGNYDDSLHVVDDQGNAVDPFPVRPNNGHGTSVAGLIAAAANGVGGTGVAHGATITGVNIFGTNVYGDVNGATDDFIAIVLQAVAFDISSNSWGAIPRQSADASLAGTGFAAQLEVAYAVLSAEGRGGLGTVITQAAGNEALDANRDGANASRHTITVAATDEVGAVQSYSNYGASILIAAPAAAVTTDVTGAAGYNDTEYTDAFGGTSAATPVTSGVIALMLEANPDLGWRDVQNILAVSASLTGSDLASGPTGFEVGAWSINGADTWNGGGLHVHSSYGYGMINAYNAVRMAEVWSLLQPVAGTSATEQTVGSGVVTLGGAGGLAVPDNSATGISFALTVQDSIAIEHVALTLNIDSARIGDVKVVLISPEGTEVVVVLNDTQVRGSVDGAWVYGIDSLRGELSAGTWTVEVTDLRTGRLTTVASASLDVYGSADGIDDVHTITDEFVVMVADDASRSVLSDTNGGTDWLNLAAVAGSVALDLTAGQSFAVNGQAWGSLSSDSSFENIVTGDGDDSLVGNAGANAMHGMRGDDVIAGGAGQDALAGGDGDDRLDGGAGVDVMSGDLGNDTYVVQDIGDQVVGEVGYWQGGGLDTVASWISYKLVNHTEALILQGDADLAGTGRVAAGDGLTGNAGNNQLFGMGGRDRIKGEAGNDILIGGHGRDWLTGAAGADVFIYRAAWESGVGLRDRDLIIGFDHGADLINLGGLDANTLVAGNQAFEFIGLAGFSGDGAASAGELRWTSQAGRDYALLAMDVDGDGAADMQVFVLGTPFMAAGDFYL